MFHCSGSWNLYGARISSSTPTSESCFVIFLFLENLIPWTVSVQQQQNNDQKLVRDATVSDSVFSVHTEETTPSSVKYTKCGKPSFGCDTMDMETWGFLQHIIITG